MQHDRLRERLESGEVAYGVITGWADPDLVEAAGACGFDFVFIDAEHGALDIATCAHLVRAAACGGLTALIRVPYADVRGVYAYLDTGAHGLIFPHVRSVADARNAVAACLFPPQGLRGAMSSSRAARYGVGLPSDKYYRAANESTWVFPVIEDVEALDVLDDILGTPGIRGYFVGPGDLGLSRIAAGRRDDQPTEALVTRAIEAGVRHRKIVATVAGTPGAAAGLVAQGVRMIGVGVTGLFTTACRGYLKDVPRRPPGGA